jgi:hypothetical protein
MNMRAYYLGEKDQTKPTWILFDSEGKNGREKSQLPQNILKFFGPRLDSDQQMKQEYLGLCCSECGKYDEDDIFAAGFRDPVTIRIKGDFGHTQDRVFIVSERCLDILLKGKVRGFVYKAIGTSGWSAVQITRRVECREGVLIPADPICKSCRRPNGAAGFIKYESEISIPDEDPTFFTTRTNWHRRPWDREIFITESVVKLLKESGIKGGYCNALWNSKEAQEIQDRSTVAKPWVPRGLSVIL